MPTLNNLAFQPIAFDVPCQDPANAKSIATGILDWTVNPSYALDPTQSNQLLEVQNIQSVFVDNYLSTGTLIITVSGTGHIIRIPPKSQAFLPLICSDRPVLTFSNSSGNGQSQAWILNILASGVVWTLP